MSDASAAAFYDDLALDYHLIFPDWDSSLKRQGEALHALISATMKVESASVLDCACGIGTQAIGLALQGHRVAGSDISRIAAGRARREAAERGLNLPTQVADMRSLPFADGAFDVVVCADNSLPHLLTSKDVEMALGEMRRVLRSDGMLTISTRDYDKVRRSRPAATLPHVGNGHILSFQLWNWREDGERYDLEHFQLIPGSDDWSVKVRRAAYWALTRGELSGFVTAARFEEPHWWDPEESNYFQPLLIARVP
ncbi:SAM-dependent methyltransferase [Micromonospora echinospora]|uniref:Methyltransferase domain-containing protein n=1 Tax=Micromonospora echinospora TaxID=1877 RepID=A0A1C4VYI5_MICEC|nr:class I SAM-dependent methyltransferase [Micromonospora echinospora]OZV80191.1 SAM-dependent methyltransferase [Micromonospora echinospora]SCE89053.1 Methyltransferase domain-containing protein [Micromonospora echinospora]